MAEVYLNNDARMYIAQQYRKTAIDEDGRIGDAELAWEMAHAEKPFVEKRRLFGLIGPSYYSQQEGAAQAGYAANAFIQEKWDERERQRTKYTDTIIVQSNYLAEKLGENAEGEDKSFQMDLAPGLELTVMILPGVDRNRRGGNIHMELNKQPLALGDITDMSSLRFMAVRLIEYAEPFRREDDLKQHLKQQEWADNLEKRNAEFEEQERQRKEVLSLLGQTAAQVNPNF